MFLQGFSRFAVLTVWYDYNICRTFNDNRFTIRIKIAMTCITLAVVSHTPPNYAAAKLSLGVNPGPVVTESFTNRPLYAKVTFL